MTTPDISVLTQLLTLLQNALTQVHALLQQENDCLITEIPKNLAAIVEQKQQQLAHIEQIQRALAELMNTDPNSLHPTIHQIITMLPAAQHHVKTLWQNIIKLINESRNLNIINGGLAHHNLSKTRQLLAILLPNNLRDLVYDAKGFVE